MNLSAKDLSKSLDSGGSLGDQMVLEEGTTFSVEPGLFDPAHDLGYNRGNNLVVTNKRAS
jgi:hypothetical protein